MISRAFVVAVALTTGSSVQAQTVAKVETPVAHLKSLPSITIGRVQPRRDGGVTRQWPGTYFEAAVIGPQVFFRLGGGEVSLRLAVDGGAPVALVKPAPGIYRWSGLGAGAHRLRITVANENQAGPTVFGGFLAPPGVGTAAAAAVVVRRPRQIEFVGDSHTVGYGNTSPGRTCDEDRVWATTDTSRGIAALTARHFDADYEVNAISGRGVVRNYDGGAADTLPVAYPFTLFDKRRPARDVDWHPQVIVIALGTNDFSTPLKAGEKWRTRDALRADFEEGYVRFVGRLRARDPGAHIVLWATDLADGEIAAEVTRVADRLRSAGDARIGFVPIAGLSFSACDHHPSVADDQKIADAIAAHLDARPGTWTGRR